MLKILLLLFISSCALFIESIETPLVKNTEDLKKAPDTPGYCSLENKVSFQLVGPNSNSQTYYQEFIKSIKGPLDFLDHFVYWNLLQMSARPDQSSPTARLQVLVNHGGKSYYFDFFSEDTNRQYPFLYGIEWILRKFGKKRSLEYYAGVLAASKVPRMKVGKDFEAFLLRNTEALKDSPEFSSYYFRGTDILKENETSPLLDLKKVLKAYREVEKNQKIIVNTSLTPFVTDKGASGSCNYDFNLYDNSIFLIDKAIPVSNLYGLSLKDSAFLASSSQKIPKIESFLGQPLFLGESKVRSSAVCMIESSSSRIWAFSNLSRDPGQHLFHLVRYGLPGSTNTAEVDRLIRHSRHLFLSEPVRLIIESARSSSDQIENLLKLNLPIYNADKLGNIWAYTQFPDGNRFIIDDRNPGAIKCQ